MKHIILFLMFFSNIYGDTKKLLPEGAEKALNRPFFDVLFIDMLVSSDELGLKKNENIVDFYSSTFSRLRNFQA